MSDNLYDKFNFNNNEEEKNNGVKPETAEQNTAPAAESFFEKQDAPIDETPVSAQQTEKGSDESMSSAPYADQNIYSDTKYEAPAQPPYTAPYGSYAQSYSQPEQNPYTNPYQRTADTTPQQSAASYNDGYYHQSFRSQSEGNHVNYTRPQNTVHTAQPYTNTAPVHEPRKESKKRSGGLSKGGIAILLVVCILVSAAAGFGGSLLASKLNQSKFENTANDTMVIHKVDTEAQVAGTEALVDKSTSEIAADVADTVVEITTEIMQTNSFYGQYIAKGAGSGVIISNDGYIITNNHVIEGASSIKVTTRDGDSYDATLVGTDDDVDIALLKINATDLKAAVFGDSSKLNVGSKAVIIGNPLGTLGGSVTEGIISALDRAIDIDGKTMHLIQTDASINPGNSGGGMFDGQGELSGIVVAKSSSSSESIDNIGFVIPINTVLDILGDLKEYGYVRGRAYTGMSFIDLSNQMYAWYYFRNSEGGVYINSVNTGSNAEKAGFQVGDRVISVDGHAITAASEIDTAISEKSAGDTVTFEVERSGSKGKIDLELEEEVPSKTMNSNSSNNYNSDPFSGFGFNR